MDVTVVAVPPSSSSSRASASPAAGAQVIVAAVAAAEEQRGPEQRDEGEHRNQYPRGDDPTPASVWNHKREKMIQRFAYHSNYVKLVKISYVKSVKYISNFISSLALIKMTLQLCKYQDTFYNDSHIQIYNMKYDKGTRKINTKNY